jgi:ribosomal protein S18
MNKLNLFILSVGLLACNNATKDNIVEADSNTATSEVSKGNESVINQEKVDTSTVANESNKIDRAIKNEETEGKSVSILNEVKKSTSPKEGNEIRVVTNENIPSPTAPNMPQIDFSKVYPEILSNFVSNSGKVNYAAIKRNSEMLGQAIFHYQENTPKNSWSSNQKLAYWINSYNLFTIKLIVDNYPLSSIKNIAEGKPWDKKFIQLDGKTMSLNDIENGIIRSQFSEPRIHFALNCASISCPKLLNQEYTAANLNTLLEKQAKRYINDENENTFTGNSAKISNIFDWYQQDFKGGIILFVNKYLSTPLPTNATISYQDYNWNLNN